MSIISSFPLIMLDKLLTSIIMYYKSKTLENYIFIVYIHALTRPTIDRNDLIAIKFSQKYVIRTVTSNSSEPICLDFRILNSKYQILRQFDPELPPDILFELSLCVGVKD